MFIFLAYVDFSKAFDVVSHNKLFVRLESYGFGGTLLTWLRNFFTGRTHCTKVGGSFCYFVKRSYTGQRFKPRPYFY